MRKRVAYCVVFIQAIISSFYKDFGSVACNSIRILGVFFPPF